MAIAARARGVSESEPAAAAEAARLQYVSDQVPGIRRRRAGRGFTYVGPDGRPIRDERTLDRIRSLAVPPAWTDVWISPIANGHLQATGRDVRGRKQYRYHPTWRRVRDETKFERMAAFGRALPKIRRRVRRDMGRPGLAREKVLAAVVRLLETTLIRVGNDEYARSNESFGLTTLRDRHAEVAGSAVRFEFRGKGGRVHRVGIDDPRLARVVKLCRDLPGHQLFQYVEDGQSAVIDSADVNAYLREITGEDFTSKDFRTWAGTVLCVAELHRQESFRSEAEARRNVAAAIERVAERLGNTPAISRACYVHPAVVEAYLDGSLRELLEGGRDVRAGTALLRDERALLRMLARLERPKRSPGGQTNRA